MSGSKFKKTKFRYFKYEIKKNDYKQTVLISLKLYMRVFFLFMGDPNFFLNLLCNNQSIITHSEQICLFIWLAILLIYI